MPRCRTRSRRARSLSWLWGPWPEASWAVEAPFDELGRPASRDVHVRTVQGGDGRTAEQPQRAVQIGAQYLDGACDPGLPGCGEAVGVSATTEHDVRAEAQGLDDVGAPSNASVHPDLELTGHR